MEAMTVSLDSVSNRTPEFIETIFSVANGHFGIRAGDILTLGSTAGTIVNGLYEESPIQYGESAYGYAKNHQSTILLPDLRILKVKSSDGFLKINSLVTKELNMRTGRLYEVWGAVDGGGKHFKISLSTVISQPGGEGVSLQYEIESVDYSGAIQINKTLQVPSNIEVDDDPRKAKPVSSYRWEKVQIDNQTLKGIFTTRNSRLRVEMSLHAPKGLETVANIKPGDTFSYDVVASVGHLNKDIKTEMNADKIRLSAEDYWSEFWKQSQVDIVGDDKLNQAINYNLFQLTSSAGRDGMTNIAAKGLSGIGYEGHYFWDTEMYMLPFLSFTNPDIAKKLLEYRGRILPQARERARVLGVNKGALFSWRTINGQEASAYYPAGTAQYHINADIAYAVSQYYSITADDAFMKACGLEILIATARFWAEFGSFGERDGSRTFEFFDVTGPDEYTAIVNNNYYTNRMAKFNLSIAAKLAQKFQDCAKNQGVTSVEIEDWIKKSELIYLPYDAMRQINAQDDSSSQKPIWPFDSTPREMYPLLLHYHPLNIYRYQVNKQADTLLADYLFEDIDFSQLKREYDYYESITTHDSSLSRSIFSALAARMGELDKAYSYFMDTACMDLVDMQGNAADGLHVANLGGSWLSIASGFGGIRVLDDKLFVKNHLPHEWQELTLRLTFRGRRLKVIYRHGETEVRLLKGDNLTVFVDDKETQIAKE